MQLCFVIPFFHEIVGAGCLHPGNLNCGVSQSGSKNFITKGLSGYSYLPNNRAANLINFGGKNTYTTLLGPTRLLIYEIFPPKPDFHLYK